MKYGLLVLLSLSCIAKTFNHDKIIKECKKQNIFKNCNLVSAIVKTESNYIIKSINPEKTVSYGLMQVQCSTARMLGFKRDCRKLLNPKLNLKYGLLYLAYQSKRYTYTADIIAAYNSGTVKKKGKKYINQDYVNKVMNFYIKNTTKQNSLVKLNYEQLYKKIDEDIFRNKSFFHIESKNTLR